MPALFIRLELHIFQQADMDAAAGNILEKFHDRPSK
jgi:hypothetical protein